MLSARLLLLFGGRGGKLRVGGGAGGGPSANWGRLRLFMRLCVEPPELFPLWPFKYWCDTEIIDCGWCGNGDVALCGVELLARRASVSDECCSNMLDRLGIVACPAGDWLLLA